MTPNRQSSNTPAEDEQPLPDEQQASTSGEDARDDKNKQQKNRKQLRVDEDHMTPEMKKGHRGTFP